MRYHFTKLCIITLSFTLVLASLGGTKTNAFAADDTASYSLGASGVYSYSNSSSAQVAANAASLAWTHDGTAYSYVDTIANSIKTFYASGELVTEQTLPAGVTPKQIIWSSNDAYIAINTGQKLYAYNFEQGPITSGGSWREIPDVLSQPDTEIIDIDWDLTTNKLMYLTDVTGISSIHIDGSDKQLVLDRASLGVTNQLVDFSTYPTYASQPAIVFVDETGLSWKYTPTPAALESLNAIDVSPGKTTAIAWMPLRHGETVPQSILFAKQDATSVSLGEFRDSTATILHSTAATETMRHLSAKPFDNRSSLYAPSFNNIQIDASTLSFDVSLFPNTTSLLGKSVSITPFIWDKYSNMATLPTEQITLSSDQRRSSSSFTHTLGDKPGPYIMGCRIESQQNPLLEAYCPYIQIDYTPPLDLTPVYRFWSDRYNHHFYTSSAAEKDNVIRTWPDVWTYEGEAFAVATPKNGICPNTTSPIYRFWSNQYNGHFYTASAAEKDNVIRTWPGIWRYESIAYCASNQPTDHFSTPLHRFWSGKYNGHFYTTSEAEKANVLKTWPDIWKYEGVAYYVAQ